MVILVGRGWWRVWVGILGLVRWLLNLNESGSTASSRVVKHLDFFLSERSWKTAPRKSVDCFHKRTIWWVVLSKFNVTSIFQYLAATPGCHWCSLLRTHMFFCSTSLPLASTRWVQSTLSSLCALTKLGPSININKIEIYCWEHWESNPFLLVPYLGF